MSQDLFNSNTLAKRKPPVLESLKRASWRMRDVPTRAENILWKEIRLKKLGGFRFRQQHVLGHYIADFYCHQAKLVVEVDGSSHENRKREDVARDSWMISMGIAVLRIRNEEVFENIEGVKEKILSILISTLKLQNEAFDISPPPGAGGTKRIGA